MGIGLASIVLPLTVIETNNPFSVYYGQDLFVSNCGFATNSREKTYKQ